MDKLLEALKLIRDECKQHDNCTDCPMWASRVGACGVDKRPQEWNVLNEVQFRPRIMGDY